MLAWLVCTMLLLAILLSAYCEFVRTSRTAGSLEHTYPLVVQSKSARQAGIALEIIRKHSELAGKQASEHADDPRSGADTRLCRI